VGSTCQIGKELKTGDLAFLGFEHSDLAKILLQPNKNKQHAGTSFSICNHGGGRSSRESICRFRMNRDTKVGSGMRLTMGKLMVAVRSPGGRRSAAGSEVLRR
jgi:hypothetical protein